MLLLFVSSLGGLFVYLLLNISLDENNYHDDSSLQIILLKLQIWQNKLFSSNSCAIFETISSKKTKCKFNFDNHSFIFSFGSGELLPSLGIRRLTVSKFFLFWISPLKLLCKFEPNLAGMMFVRSLTKIHYFVLIRRKTCSSGQFLFLIGWNLKNLLWNYNFKWFVKFK